MVTIVIITYNEERHIKECLDSLVNQTQKADEIILVDDGSTDKTLEIASKYPVKIIKSDHRERSHARNTGWKKAQGDYILFAEADAIFCRTWVKEIMQQFEKGADAVIDRRKMYQPKTYFQKVMDAQFDIRYHKYQPFSAWAFKRIVLTKVEGFDESMNQSEDRELGKRILAQGYHISLAQKAIQYHKGEPGNLYKYLKRAFDVEVKRMGNYYKKFPKEKPIGKLVGIIVAITLISLTFGWSVFGLLLLIYFLIQYLFILSKIIFREQGMKVTNIETIAVLAFYRFLRNYAAGAGYIIGNL